MSRKHLVAFAVALAFGGSVWADPINAVVTDPGDPGTFAVLSPPATAILGAFNPPGGFVDIYAFNLDALQQFTISLTNSIAGQEGRINFFAGVLTPPGSPLGDLTLIVSSPTSQTLFGSWTATTAGIYLLAVAGEVVGDVAAGYAGAAIAVAIPEPSTYALMLAGLGAVGLVASRRRSPAK